MAITISWTKRALGNFNKILNYLQRDFGEKTTKTFVIKVHNFIENLMDFPELGAIQNQEKEIRGFVISKQISIFYRIQKDQIIILNIFDNRKDSKNR
jgi:plasmid stabilization system protein ParE